MEQSRIAFGPRLMVMKGTTLLRDESRSYLADKLRVSTISAEYSHPRPEAGAWMPQPGGCGARTS